MKIERIIVSNKYFALVWTKITFTIFFSVKEKISSLKVFQYYDINNNGNNLIKKWLIKFIYTPNYDKLFFWIFIIIYMFLLLFKDYY